MGFFAGAGKTPSSSPAGQVSFPGFCAPPPRGRHKSTRCLSFWSIPTTLRRLVCQALCAIAASALGFCRSAAPGGAVRVRFDQVKVDLTPRPYWVAFSTRKNFHVAFQQIGLAAGFIHQALPYCSDIAHCPAKRHADQTINECRCRRSW